MGHVVRKAWSTRCSLSAHGHSFVLEAKFEGTKPDKGQMLSDFGFLKKIFNPFVDSFDHSFLFWNLEEDKHIIDFFKKEFARVIVTPWSSSAESQSEMFAYYLDLMIKYLDANNLWENGEQEVKAYSAMVHETVTGYSEAFCRQETSFPNMSLKDIEFSDAIKSEWTPYFLEVYPKLIEFEETHKNVSLV